MPCVTFVDVQFYACKYAVILCNGCTIASIRGGPKHSWLGAVAPTQILKFQCISFILEEKIKKEKQIRTKLPPVIWNSPVMFLSGSAPGWLVLFICVFFIIFWTVSFTICTSIAMCYQVISPMVVPYSSFSSVAGIVAINYVPASL